MQRLLAEVPEEKLKAVFTKYIYELTDTGKEELRNTNTFLISTGMG